MSTEAPVAKATAEAIVVDAGDENESCSVADHLEEIGKAPTESTEQTESVGDADGRDASPPSLSAPSAPAPTLQQSPPEPVKPAWHFVPGTSNGLKIEMPESVALPGLHNQVSTFNDSQTPPPRQLVEDASATNVPDSRSYVEIFKEAIRGRKKRSLRADELDESAIIIPVILFLPPQHRPIVSILKGNHIYFACRSNTPLTAPEIFDLEGESILKAARSLTAYTTSSKLTRKVLHPHIISILSELRRVGVTSIMDSNVDDNTLPDIGTLAPQGVSILILPCADVHTEKCVLEDLNEYQSAIINDMPELAERLYRLTWSNAFYRIWNLLTATDVDLNTNWLEAFVNSAAKYSPPAPDKPAKAGKIGASELQKVSGKSFISNMASEARGRIKECRPEKYFQEKREKPTGDEGRKIKSVKVSDDENDGESSDESSDDDDELSGEESDEEEDEETESSEEGEDDDDDDEESENEGLIVHANEQASDVSEDDGEEDSDDDEASEEDEDKKVTACKLEQPKKVPVNSEKKEKSALTTSRVPKVRAPANHLQKKQPVIVPCDDSQSDSIAALFARQQMQGPKLTARDAFKQASGKKPLLPPLPGPSKERANEQRLAAERAKIVRTAGMGIDRTWINSVSGQEGFELAKLVNTNMAELQKNDSASKRLDCLGHMTNLCVHALKLAKRKHDEAERLASPSSRKAARLETAEGIAAYANSTVEVFPYWIKYTESLKTVVEDANAMQRKLMELATPAVEAASRAELTLNRQTPQDADSPP